VAASRIAKGGRDAKPRSSASIARKNEHDREYRRDHGEVPKHPHGDQRHERANASIDLFPWDEALLRVGKNLARILATIRHTAGSREFRGSDA